MCLILNPAGKVLGSTLEEVFGDRYLGVVFALNSPDSYFSIIFYTLLFVLKFVYLFI